MFNESANNTAILVSTLTFKHMTRLPGVDKFPRFDGGDHPLFLVDITGEERWHANRVKPTYLLLVNDEGTFSLNKLEASLVVAMQTFIDRHFLFILRERFFDADEHPVDERNVVTNVPYVLGETERQFYFAEAPIRFLVTHVYPVCLTGVYSAA